MSLAAKALAHRLRITLIPVLVIVPLSHMATAEVYHLLPDSTLHLGGGFNPQKPTTSFPTCITSDGVKAFDNDAPASTTFILTVVHDRKSLYSHLNLDANLSARSLFASGEASMSIDDEYSFSSDSLVWILTARTDFGRYGLLRPTLSARGLGILKHDPSHFARRCGVEYVDSERRVAQVSAIFSIQNASSETKNQVTAAIKLSGSSGAASGEFSAAFKTFTQDTSLKNKINVRIVTIGGGGLKELAPLTVLGSSCGDDPKAPTSDICTAVGTMKTYLSTFTAASAPPVDYFTGKMSAFGAPAFEDPDLLMQNLVLSELFFAFKDGDAKARRVLKMFRDDQTSSKALTADQRTALTRDYESLADTLSAVTTRARTCLADSKKCSLKPLIPYVKVRFGDYLACRLPANGVDRQLSLLLFAECVPRFGAAQCEQAKSNAVEFFRDLVNEGRAGLASANTVPPLAYEMTNPPNPAAPNTGLCPSFGSGTVGCWASLNINVFKKLPNADCGSQ